MKDECLICGAPLTYLENDTEMECALCHKIENSNVFFGSVLKKRFRTVRYAL